MRNIETGDAHQVPQAGILHLPFQYALLQFFRQLAELTKSLYLLRVVSQRTSGSREGSELLTGNALLHRSRDLHCHAWANAISFLRLRSRSGLRQPHQSTVAAQLILSNPLESGLLDALNRLPCASFLVLFG